MSTLETEFGGALAKAKDMLAPAPRPDPVLWVGATLHEHPWSVQAAIMRSVWLNRRTAVKACFDVGKSWLAARLCAWWVGSTSRRAFFVSTAPTFPQVRAILWREIGMAHRKGKLPGRVNQTEWLLAEDRRHRVHPAPGAGEELVGMGRKPPATDSGVAFQGIHSGEGGVLVIIDEAAGVPPGIWDAAEGLMADEASRLLVIGNPDDPVGPFANCFLPDSGWDTFKVSVFDSPNFTDEVVAPSVARSLVSRLWVQERRQVWGEDHPLWTSRVLGEFPDAASNTVLPLSWARAAQVRELDPPDGAPTLGVDVARFGTDDSVIAACIGPCVSILDVIHGQDTVQVAGKVRQRCEELRCNDAHVDGVGVGAGVVDMLRSWPGYPTNVADMQAGQAAHDSERFADARSEWWWGVRERAEAGDLDLPSEGPHAERLLAELTAPRYVFDARGRIKVESKDSLKARGLPSPDVADAVIMGLAKSQAWTFRPVAPGGDTRKSPLAELRG